MSAKLENIGWTEILLKRHMGIVLVLLAYVTIQSFAVTAPLFAMDDNQQLAACNEMESWYSAFGIDAFQLFRPIKNLLFMVFKHLEPYGVVYCRMIAIVIGILSFFPVHGLMKRIFDRDGPALGAAAIWLLAPTLVSATAWLSCVNIQVMCGAAAGALLLHDRAWEGSKVQKGQIAGAAALLFLALVSYESAIAVGPAIVCFDYFLRPGRFRSRGVWVSYCLYAGVSVAYLLVRLALGATGMLNGSIVGGTRLDLCLASAYFACLHFGVWCFPFGQMSPQGAYIVGTVPSVVLYTSWGIVLGLMVLTLFLRRYNPICAFGLAFAALTFLPVSNILGFGNGPYGDYYVALPSMGCALVVMALALWLFSVRGMARKCALAMCGMLLLVRGVAAVESARWAALWGDNIGAFISGSKAQPWAFSNWMLLARVCSESGLFDAASLASNEAERILGPDAEMMCSVWMFRTVGAIRSEKNAEKALECLVHAESCVRLDRPLEPRHRQVPERQYAARMKALRQCSYYRGCIYEDLLNDPVRAERAYEAGLSKKWDVDTVACADRLARLRAVRGDLTGAIELWEKALKLKPNDPVMKHNLRLARQNGTPQKKQCVMEVSLPPNEHEHFGFYGL